MSSITRLDMLFLASLAIKKAEEDAALVNIIQDDPTEKTKIATQIAIRSMKAALKTIEFLGCGLSYPHLQYIYNEASKASKAAYSI